MSLRLRILVAVAVLSLPGVGFLAYGAVQGYRAADEAGRVRVVNAARSAAHGAGWVLSLAENISVAFASADPAALLDPEQCAGRVQATSDLVPFYVGLTVVDASGVTVCSGQPLRGPAPVAGDRSWFQELMRTGDFVVSEPVLGRVSGLQVLVLAAPILGEDGRPVGAVSGGLELASFAEMIRGAVPDSAATITLADADGNVVARTADLRDWLGRPLAPPTDPVVESGPDWQIFRTVTPSGDERVVGRIDLPGRGWRVYAGFDSEEVYGAGYAMARNQALVAAALLLFALLVGGLTYRDLSARLSELVSGVELAASGHAVPMSPGQPEELAAVAEQLNRTLEERAEAEERHRDFFENVPLGAAVTTPDGRFIEVNEALVSLLGYPDSEALTAAGVAALYRDPSERDRLMQDIITSGAFEGVEVEWLRADGEPVLVRLYGRHLAQGGESRFEVIAEDITERVRLQEVDQHRQKTEAIGRLAGGVSHEINNVLTVIGGNSEVLASDLGPEHGSVPEVEGIRRAVARATALTRSLLAISRKDMAQPEILVLREVVGEVGAMLQKLLPAEVELEIPPVPAAARIWMNRSHLEQVLLNLSVNARDAMPEGGTLTISTRLESHPEGRVVILAVSDEGVGMDRNTQTRIFEPYYTTKARGSGTGLGLATVQGLIGQAEGTIRVRSQVGVGTTFEIEWAQRSEPPPTGNVPVPGHV